SLMIHRACPEYAEETICFETAPNRDSPLAYSPGGRHDHPGNSHVQNHPFGRPALRDARSRVQEAEAHRVHPLPRPAAVLAQAPGRRLGELAHRPARELRVRLPPG